MKTISPTILFVLIYLVFIPFAVYGQNLKGQWNGVLQTEGTQLRMVLHITMTDNRYSATLDSPDQSVSGIKVTAIDFSYPDVKFEIATIGMVYEGTLSGNRITGTWRQSGRTFPVILAREEDK